MLSPYSKGYLEVVAGSILFGLIGIFVKLIEQMPLGAIIFFRLFFGLFAIALYLAYTGRFNEITLKDKKMYVLMLGIFQAGAMFAYFISIRYTTVPIAVLLLYTAPIYIILISPFILKEPVTRHSLSALAISIAGVIMVIQPGELDMHGMNIIGLTTGLISGLFYALYILTSRYLRDNYTGTSQASWALFVTLVIFSPYSATVSLSDVLNNLHVLLLFGLIPTAMGAILYLSGLRKVRAQSASIIGLLEPGSAVFFAFMILNEPISYTTLIGGSLILSGAVLITREKKLEMVHD